MTRSTASRLVRLVAPLLLSTGCHTLHFQVSDAPAELVPVVDRQTFWLFGCLPAHDIDVRAICPNGVAAIEETNSFSDVLLTAITLQIYTPRTTSYYCRLRQDASR